jgi:hypothetical protein
VSSVVRELTVFPSPIEVEPIVIVDADRSAGEREPFGKVTVEPYTVRLLIDAVPDAVNAPVTTTELVILPDALIAPVYNDDAVNLEDALISPVYSDDAVNLPDAVNAPEDVVLPLINNVLLNEALVSNSAPLKILNSIAEPVIPAEIIPGYKFAYELSVLSLV